MKQLRPFLLALGLLLGWTVAAEVMPPSPAGYFNDYSGKVSSAKTAELNERLRQFEQMTSSQIVVAVFPKMESESSLEDYVHRIFQNWKIGQKEKNNGALLAVFVQDRKMRIEVGYGLEGSIPDITAKRIIADEIGPRFKAGDFDGGLEAGVSALLRAAQGNYTGAVTTPVHGMGRGQGSPSLGIVPLLIIIIFIFAVFGRRGRRRGWVISSGHSSWGGGWSSGGGGGWSSGGGGGGFSGGGGSSGGGGASGSW